MARGAWLGVAVLLASGPTGAARAAAAGLAPSGEPADAPLDIGELWQQAQARMDTADYGEAIELLTRVYDAIAVDPEAAALRSRVQWALHQAHRGAHRVDGDAQHLYVARDLLRKYRDALPAGEAERQAEAEAALVEVEAQIAEHEASRRPSEPGEPEPAVTEPEPAEPEPATEPGSGEPGPGEPGPGARSPVAPRGLIIAGAVTAGLGAVGLGVMAGGLGMASAAVDRFRTQPEQRAAARLDIKKGNAIAIAGAAAGGALLVSGAVVLGLGLRYRAGRGGSLAAGPGQLGLGWRLRF